MVCYCPKCDADISSEVYDTRWEGEDMQEHKFICPHCDAKLVTYALIEYDVAEDDDISIDLDDLNKICGYLGDLKPPNNYGAENYICKHKDSRTSECHHHCCPMANYDYDIDLMVPYDQEILNKLKRIGESNE